MTMGHNSIAKDQLRSFIERVERLNGEKAELQADIKEVFKEAKSAGLDVKAMRAVIRERAQDAGDLALHQALVDMYKVALGMLLDTPLGRAAVAKVEAREPVAAE